MHQPRRREGREARRFVLLMAERVHNVLFLCTGNSARSILCEAYLNAHGRGRFAAYSAGSFPKGEVNPFTLDTLGHAGLGTGGYRSKSWDEFSREGAPQMDFVITVCDSAAGEVCPTWPGQPVTAHWSFSDPAAFDGPDDEKHRRFREIFRQIRNRIDLLMQLPLARLERLAVKRELDAIGRNES
jgi:arsenate reductase